MDETLRDLLLQPEPPSDAEVARRIGRTLEAFEVIRKGLVRSGEDNGTRPVHLVLLASSFTRFVNELPPSQPALASRLAGLLVAAARACLIEFSGARSMVGALIASNRLAPSDALRWRAAVDPAAATASAIGGFRACCGEPRGACT